MTRIYGAYVYSDGPRAGCFWDDTCAMPSVPELQEPCQTDVAIIGAGVTGLNAALELAKRGTSVVVLDAQTPGWGASGRNGGFCCVGGGKLSERQIDRRFGVEARFEWRAAEKSAVAHVAGFLDAYGIDAAVHSQGETVLAHSGRQMASIETEAKTVEGTYGVTPALHSAAELDQLGMRAGFHGGMTLPIGFALNPRIYLAGLLRACLAEGVKVFQRSPVTSLSRSGNGWIVQSGARVSAKSVVVATNGYASEHVPDWLAGRYLPTQSNVLVTRPMQDAELARQGWTSHQMCYDSRHLLHYFHLLPDNRMLFGMRGGLGSSAASDQRAGKRLLRDFHRMFPAWRGIEITHQWSGMVCLSRKLMPFVGPIPKTRNLWCAIAYHGNGVAMGSYAGFLVARAMCNGGEDIPVTMSAPLHRFPLGRFRRAVLPAVYGAMMVSDWF